MKKLSVLFAVLLLLSLFTACGDQATSATVPATTSPPVTSAPVDPASVHPLLFRVTGPDGQEGCLFGTIHLGDERNAVALEKLAPWLETCDALAVEYDIVDYETRLMTDLAAQVAYYTPFVLTDGTTAQDHMPAETWEAAYALVKEAKLIPSAWKQYNLGWWAQLVEQAAILTRTDYDLELGMDRQLIRFCMDKGIEVRSVETPEFQNALLASFSDELNLMMIDSVLENLDRYEEDLGQLFEAWVAGDPETLTQMLTEDTEGLTPDQQALLEDYYDKLLTQRNLGMAEKAMEWLRAGDRVFFAVGAAHLVGEGGLADLLEEVGYTVEQVIY